MKRYKKVVSLLLGGLMAVSFAGCGTDTSADSSSSNGGAQVSADGKTQIMFWHAMGGVNGEAVQTLVDGFNASQDEIYVTAEYQGKYDDTITKLKAAMQSGNSMPDVCQMYDVGTKFMADSGSIIPVEDMFATTGYDKNTVMEVITSYYSVDGKQYSMPFNVSTPALYYNKEVFAAAGLDPETPPTTFDEVLEYSKQIVESGAAPVGYTQAIYGWFFEQNLAGLGATYGNNDNGRSGAVTEVDFNTNGAGLQVLQTWKDLYDSGYFENYGTATSDSQTAFFSGQCAMMVDSTATLKNATESCSFDFGTGYFPKIGNNADGGVIIGGASLWLMDTKDDAKKEAAWKFIEYCTNADVQAEWSMATGYFAINPAAYETEEMKAYLEENPNFATAINQLNDTPVNNYTAGVLSGVQTESRQLFNEVMQQVYDGTMTPQEGVDTLAEKVNKAIENYNASISN